RFTPTATAEDRDGPVRVTRVGRLANVAKLDVTPGLSALLRKLLRDPPDVWHLHAPNVTMMLAVLVNRRIRPLVVTHHSDIIRRRLLRHAVRPLETALYRRAARILPTSSGYAEGSDLLRPFTAKLTPVPLGMNLAPFLVPSPAARAHADRFRAQFAGPLWLCV